jgi:uncharacterized protein (DUF2384 family)
MTTNQDSMLPAKQKIVCDVIELYEGDVETAIWWLSQPIRALNDKRPLDCLSDSEQMAELRSVIRKIERGDFS